MDERQAKYAVDTAFITELKRRQAKKIRNRKIAYAVAIPLAVAVVVVASVLYLRKINSSSSVSSHMPLLT